MIEETDKLVYAGVFDGVCYSCALVLPRLLCRWLIRRCSVCECRQTLPHSLVNRIGDPLLS